MVARYRPSRVGWNAIAMSPQIQAACVAVAYEGKAYAQSISPSSGGQDGVPYAGSLEVETITVVGAFDFNPRVGARLRNTAPHAAAVEYGNRQRPTADRVLGRTEDFLTGGGA